MLHHEINMAQVLSKKDNLLKYYGHNVEENKDYLIYDFCNCGNLNNLLKYTKKRRDGKEVADEIKPLNELEV